jgi:hypothetical protein
MTDPIPPGRLAKIASRRQANRWRASLQQVIQFRAYCCNINSDLLMGVSKMPVPVLEISPTTLCVDDWVSWDLRGSYAPGSTITSVKIDMGDGYVYGTPDDHGVHQYTVAGSYTVIATVTEGTGLEQSIEVEINVIDCDEGLMIGFSYAALDGQGVYFRDWSDSPPTWAARNDGLEGSALYVNSLSLRPGHTDLPDTVHEVWIATDGGVYRSMNGGREWRHMILPDPSNAEFSDSPAATVDELEFYKIVHSITDPDVLWVMAGKPSVSRIWVYKTSDDGFNWSSRGLTMS